ncbi:MAG TPA: helix-turn-helix transcriptional regulator, partial [Polyangiaceae bacterium]|nr:helix-turn-helix transcriptional regulator [Polyangiaceae bacterium]
MSAPTSEKLARNLRRLRELRGVSQQRLAELAGVPRPTLANLESGDANPTLSVMVRVAQALGASLEDLVSEPTSSVLERRQAEALVKRRRGRASFQALAEDRALGFCLERIELSPNAKLNQPEGDAARRYLCCEAGELVVS